MESRPFSALLLSADRALLRQLTRFLSLCGYDVRQAVDMDQALAAAEAGGADFLLVDGALQPSPSLSFFRAVRAHAPAGYTYALLMVESIASPDVAKALESGFDDFLEKPLNFGEILTRLRAGARLIEFERRMDQQQGIDLVTKLPNSNTFFAHLQKHLEKVQERNARESLGALCLFDLDYFGRFARRLGKDASDRLVRAAGGLLNLEGSPNVMVATQGGNRFAVLLADATEEQAVEWAQQHLAKIAEKEFPIGNDKLRLTASGGVVEFARGMTAERALEVAKEVLLLAKSSGRNCIVSEAIWKKDADAWNKTSSGGQLFSTTRALDVMTPCSVFVGVDDLADEADSLLAQTRLPSIPVLDREAKLAGLYSASRGTGKQSRPNNSRVSGSVRLVRHVMSKDAARFDESASLDELMEYFTGEHNSTAVIVRRERPVGIVHCQSLAALNEPLSRNQFLPAIPFSTGSEYLMIPEVAAAD